MLNILVFLSLILASAFSMAEEDPCDGASRSAIALCASNRAEAADATLNAAYQRALSAAGPDNPTRSKLVSAQRQWLKFMQSSCKLEQSFSVSEDDYWVWATRDHCVARLSLERAKTLEYYACVFSEGAADLQCQAP
jgi:uncharacterized protein YecT (DUF1311 family)